MSAAEFEFELVTAPIDSIDAGALIYSAPAAPVGAAVTRLPPDVRLTATTATQPIFAYRRESNSGIEVVNVQLLGTVEYDGAQVSFRVSLAHGDCQSCLDSSAWVSVGNPSSVEAVPSPEHFQSVGLACYPVVRVPVEVVVAHPWPADCYRATFNVVVSGQCGFGSLGTDVYEDLAESWSRSV